MYRDKVKQKYEDLKFNCKICAQEIKIDQAKDHSSLCKTRAEVHQQIKNLERKVSEVVLEAFLNSKRLQTQLIIDRYSSNSFNIFPNKSLAKSILS